MNPEFLEIAERIGARLCRDAVWSGGRCNWTSEYMEGATVAYGSLGPQLYDGTSGIALFLWRLAEATGDRIIRQTALGAIGQALSKMPQPGCGRYAGGMSILFAAAEIHGDCEEIAVIRQAALNPAELDVVSGSAGCIGVLLHLHRQRGGNALLDAAVSHGDLLLSQAARDEAGWSWKTIAERPNLTGFAHGAAGIASALAELSKVTGEARFRSAALEGFRFERTCFNPTVRNWPDFRENPPSYPVAWCHGAGGVAFSRLRAWQVLGDETLLTEARTALTTVSVELAHGESFCLCHGIAGNADLLLYASQILGEEAWRKSAQIVAEEGAARYEQRSRPWPCGLPKGNEVQGLMLGTAGIGYFYLRLADPANVPTVLATSSPAIGRSPWSRFTQSPDCAESPD